MSTEASRLTAAALRLRRRVAARFRQPAFWGIQASVIVISAIHFALEAGLMPVDTVSLATVHHVPVILYLVPVSYAGLKFGWEGGVLTGLSAGTFAVINVLFFNVDDFAWVLEVLFAALVLGMGMAMALPVERERRQRQRAESAVRHLEWLHELALVGTQSESPGTLAHSVIFDLVRLAEIDDAALVVSALDGTQAMFEVSHPPRSPLDTAAQREPRLRAEGLRRQGFEVVHTEATAGNVRTRLTVSTNPEKALSQDLASFLGAVVHQLTIQVANAILEEQEKTAMTTYVKLVTEAQEEERRRLARDLHDGPAQQLAVLLRHLEDNGGTNVSAVRSMASETLNELRRVARDQRPTLLDDLGIVPALEWLVFDTDHRIEASVSLEVHGLSARLHPDIEVGLFRIAQEALRNAERHAGASKIKLTLRFELDHVILLVTDDGAGFRQRESPRGYLDAGRLGLIGMKERAELVGGTLTVESAPGTGTTITGHVPTARIG